MVIDRRLVIGSTVYTPMPMDMLINMCVCVWCVLLHHGCDVATSQHTEEQLEF